MPSGIMPIYYENSPFLLDYFEYIIGISICDDEQLQFGLYRKNKK